MSAFTWQYEAADGRTLEIRPAGDGPFPSQADAETWVGENWKLLLGEGVDQVTLLQEGEVVYGPMSLHPAG